MSDDLLTTDLTPSSVAIATQDSLDADLTAQPLKVSSFNLLWRSSTGENRLWQMQGSQRSSVQSLARLNVDWQVVGIGDFNRDWQDDLLWHNSKTGEVQIWILKGAAVQQRSTLGVLNAKNWQARGIADFDGDGQNDIIWRNSVTGENKIWFLDGATHHSDQAVFQIPSQDWKISGVGDFNQDGQADLFWHNTKTGETALWLMNKGNLSQGIWMLTVSETDWKVAAVRDFNRDGKVDVLWHNERSGGNIYWQFNKSQYQDMVWLPSAPSKWQIISTVDLDADGYSDLLWQNPTTGELTRWLMDDRTAIDRASLGGLDYSQWQAVGALQTSGATGFSLRATTVPIPSAAYKLNGIDATSQDTPTFNAKGQVDSGKLSDFYRFTLSEAGVFSASLTGLSDDADVRLIYDRNNNETRDENEIVAWRWERGSTPESIRRFLEPGTYFVEVQSHKGKSTGYNLTTNFSAATSDPDGFRINIVFADSVSGLSESARQAVLNAAKFWENAITGKSRITRTNQLNITISGQTLVNSDGTVDNTTLALSGPSVGVDDKDRLVITRGGSTLNLRRLADFNNNPAYLESVMKHELVHVLGFGTIWEPVEFRDVNGTTFTSQDRNLVNRSNSTYIADSYAGYAYGGLLGTNLPTAIPIEPQIFAHWDETHFDTELMTPFTEGQNVATPLSMLTLASLRDIGWDVNFGVAEAYSLPRSIVAAVSESTSPPANQQARSLVAALRCGCSRCIADMPGNPLTATQLEDAIA